MNLNEMLVMGYKTFLHDKSNENGLKEQDLS